MSHAVYLRLPVDSDLCIAALECAHELLGVAMGDCTVHVSPGWLAEEPEWFDGLNQHWPNGRISVVADPEIHRNREWFAEIGGARVGSAL